MPPLNVLIVGASIAGPTAAYWFAKAGAKVTIIERFPHLRTNGQNVDIRTSGVSVMRKMPGMEAAVRLKTTPMEGISFVDGHDHPFATIRPTGNPDQQSLVSEYEIFRGDLAQILFDMTRENENITYVFGEQVVSIEQRDDDDDGPVRVAFSNDIPTAEFDLVVACDGATSRTRAIGLQTSVWEHIRPLNWWTAFFTIQDDLLDGSRMGRSYSAVGGRFVGVGPDPSGVNRVTMMGIHPRNAGADVMRSFREAQKGGPEEEEEEGLMVKKFVTQHYQGVGWKCNEIIDGMIESEDFYATEMVQVKVPCLFKGRFALVGDAGYAGAPGSGTSLALTGAYVLAGEICKHGKGVGAGLQGYEKRMRPLIDDLQRMPPFIPAILGPQTSWGLWLRNSLLAFICWSGVLNFAQRFTWSNSSVEIEKYKVPDYEWER
ncbi:hypothetical protein FE257_007464 [Aspergillus nanangensis]|uniref:FAD-binding domain-containing protein n=1 Tax=Aspergillus nanangensis TaxID=2582783 RepID=A0AAD4CMP5_ASPNN|nr:hypothetical protein FE257_007464 [Aspergillus nanangensis]